MTIKIITNTPDLILIFLIINCSNKCSWQKQNSVALNNKINQKYFPFNLPHKSQFLVYHLGGLYN